MSDPHIILHTRFLKAVREKDLQTLKEILDNSNAQQNNNNPKKQIIFPQRPYNGIVIGNSGSKISGKNNVILLFDINYHNESDEDKTGLHYAVDSGSLEIIRLLLDNGAIVDCTNSLGSTPLFWANSRQVAELLIQR